MNRTKRIYLALLAILLTPTQANTAIIWDWSISAGFAGTITTPGTDPISGVYQITDFEVTSTVDPLNFALGSVSGGQYIEGVGIYSDFTPAQFTWDAILLTTTAWGTAFGNNTGEFYSASDNLDRINFGCKSPCGFDPLSLRFAPNNTNVADFAGLHGLMPRIDIPEPGTLALLGVGLLGMASIRRRKNSEHLGVRGLVDTPS